MESKLKKFPDAVVWMEVAHFEEKARRNSIRKRKQVATWAALARQEYQRFNHKYELRVLATENTNSHMRIWASITINLCRDINKFARKKISPWSERISHIAARLNEFQGIAYDGPPSTRLALWTWSEVFQSVLMHEARSRRHGWHKCFYRTNQSLKEEMKRVAVVANCNSKI